MFKSLIPLLMMLWLWWRQWSASSIYKIEQEMIESASKIPTSSSRDCDVTYSYVRISTNSFVRTNSPEPPRGGFVLFATTYNPRGIK